MEEGEGKDVGKGRREEGRRMRRDGWGKGKSGSWVCMRVRGKEKGKGIREGGDRGKEGREECKRGMRRERETKTSQWYF